MFKPENLGPLIYTAYFEKIKKDVAVAFNVTCVGDNKKYSLYQLNENSLSDKVVIF